MIRSELKTKFAAAVKARRNKLCLTQEQLAERADLHRTYISDIERGDRNLSLENISKLASALEISISDLFRIIPLSSEKKSQAPFSTEAARFVRILLVEDDPDDVELTLAAFKQARFSNHVHVVRDGAEALDYIFCRGRQAHRQSMKRPEVILLDLGLPKVSGLEVLRLLKTDKETKLIRVVVLTSSKNDGDIAECRRLGANAYIVKPVDFTSLSRATPQLNLEWALVEPAGGKLKKVPEKSLTSSWILNTG